MIGLTATDHLDDQKEEEREIYVMKNGLIDVSPIRSSIKVAINHRILIDDQVSQRFYDFCLNHLH